MKALTIWQPWASLILIGAKPYEFRGWTPPRSMIGQRIAIHAGARPMKKNEIFELIMQLKEPKRFGQSCLLAEKALPMLETALERMHSLPLSHVLCTATLGQPKRGDLVAREFGEGGGNDSDRDGTFNWGWPLTEIRELTPPAEARGAQGFWNWSDLP